jgi:hypothetical protein
MKKMLISCAMSKLERRYIQHYVCRKRRRYHNEWSLSNGEKKIGHSWNLADPLKTAETSKADTQPGTKQ